MQVRTSCDSHYIHTGREDPKGRDSGQTRAEFMRSGGPAPVPLRHRECCFFCVCVCKRDTGDLKQPTTAGVAYLL